MSDGTTRINDETRERWLERAVDAYRLAFTRAGHPLPDAIRVSVMSSRARSRRGECWPRERSSDRSNQMFISAKVVEPVEVLSTLVHELCHAADDCEHGHRRPFQNIAAAVGLAGPPWTSSELTDEGRINADAIAEALGPYPHAKLDAARKTQTTRMVKAACDACGFTVRLTSKWLAECGAPLCPVDMRPCKIARDVPVREPLDTLSGASKLLDRFAATPGCCIGLPENETWSQIVRLLVELDADSVGGWLYLLAPQEEDERERVAQ